MNLFRRIKLRIASFIDGYSNKCWGDLVLWGLGFKSYSEIGQHSEDCGYCGKRRITNHI